MRQLIDAVGEKHGKLTIISRSKFKTKDGIVLWDCMCECGNIKRYQLWDLRAKKTKSCGCSKAEFIRKARTIHNGVNRIEYRTWSGIKTRCYNKNDKQYKNYGGRGISMCSRWINSFENFISDMGYRPDDKTSIDRINVNGNYEPDNCRWADRSEQAKNRTNNIILKFNDMEYTIRDFSEMLSVKIWVVKWQLRKGLNAVEIYNKIKRPILIIIFLLACHPVICKGQSKNIDTLKYVFSEREITLLDELLILGDNGVSTSDNFSRNEWKKYHDKVMHIDSIIWKQYLKYHPAKALHKTPAKNEKTTSKN